MGVQPNGPDDGNHLEGCLLLRRKAQKMDQVKTAFRMLEEGGDPRAVFEHLRDSYEGDPARVSAVCSFFSLHFHHDWAAGASGSRPDVALLRELYAVLGQGLRSPARWWASKSIPEPVKKLKKKEAKKALELARDCGGFHPEVAFNLVRAASRMGSRQDLALALLLKAVEYAPYHEEIHKRYASIEPATWNSFSDKLYRDWKRFTEDSWTSYEREPKPELLSPEEAKERVLLWLNQNPPWDAPEGSRYESLGTLADDGEVDSLREALSTTPPDSFWESLANFGGGVCLPPGRWTFLRAGEVEEEYRFCQKQRELYWNDFEAISDDRLEPGWWNEMWVPYARDIGGNFLMVDTKPGSAGEYGQLLLLDNVSGPGYFHPSISSFLTRLVADLESGNASWD